MSDLAQEGVQVAIDYRPFCFEAGHTCTNNICYDCSGVAARELVAEQTAALRAAFKEVLALFGDLDTYEQITPPDAEKVRRISMIHGASVADLRRWCDLLSTPYI